MVVYGYIDAGKISTTVSRLIEVDLYTSAGLLGLGGVVEGLKTRLSK